MLQMDLSCPSILRDLICPWLQWLPWDRDRVCPLWNFAAPLLPRAIAPPILANWTMPVIARPEERERLSSGKPRYEPGMIGQRIRRQFDRVRPDRGHDSGLVFPLGELAFIGGLDQILRHLHCETAGQRHHETLVELVRVGHLAHVADAQRCRKVRHDGLALYAVVAAIYDQAEHSRTSRRDHVPHAARREAPGLDQFQIVVRKLVGVAVTEGWNVQEGWEQYPLHRE